MVSSVGKIGNLYGTIMLARDDGIQRDNIFEVNDATTNSSLLLMLDLATGEH